MTNPANYPLLVFLATFLVLWIASHSGLAVQKRRKALDPDTREDLGVVLAATLTLLGLIIGFTFSMASTRYEQRRLYEENEANAIGTEYLRADILPAADAARIKALLATYLDQRIAFYRSARGPELTRINAETALLQAELWKAVLPAAAATPTPEVSLAVSGMNDVINRQGYTQAAWWNRIPTPAWFLMIAIALCANLLLGYSARRGGLLLLILPLIVSVSFLLIADIDSPRGGIIRVEPRNLVSLAESLHPNPEPMKAVTP